MCVEGYRGRKFEKGVGPGVEGLDSRQRTSEILSEKTSIRGHWFRFLQSQWDIRLAMRLEASDHMFSGKKTEV